MRSILSDSIRKVFQYMYKSSESQLPYHFTKNKSRSGLYRKVLSLNFRIILRGRKVDREIYRLSTSYCIRISHSTMWFKSVPFRIGNC